jgi:hypothetical protein
MGVQWKRMMESGFGAEMRKQMKAAPMPAVPGVGSIQDILDNVDSVLLAAAPETTDARGKKNSAFLAVVRGRFEAEQIRRLFTSQAKGAPERYQGVELFAPSQAAGTSYGVMLDSQTVVFGGRKEVLGAVDRFQGRSAGRSAQLSPRAVELASKHDFWMLLDVPPQAFAPAAAKGSVPPGVDQITGIEAGSSFGEGLNFEMNLRTKTPDAAKNLAAAVQGLLAMGMMQQQDIPELGDMMKKLQIGAEEASVRVSLSLSQEEMDRMSKVMQARLKTPSPRAQARTIVEPPRPARGTIRIEGLDQGILEIPAKQQ